MPLVLTGLNLYSLRNNRNPWNDCINDFLSLVHWKLLFIEIHRAHFCFLEMPYSYKLVVDIRCFWWTENLTFGKLHRFLYLSCRWLSVDTLKKNKTGIFFFPSTWNIIPVYFMNERFPHISIRVIYLL